MVGSPHRSMLFTHTSMSSSSGGSYPHEPPFFLRFSTFHPCLQPSQSSLLWYKKNQNSSSGRPIPDFHCFDNTRTLRYKFGNNVRVTFYRSRKGEKNESQKLGVPRLRSGYLRRLFSPFVRQKRNKNATGDVGG